MGLVLISQNKLMCYYCQKKLFQTSTATITASLMVKQLSDKQSFLVRFQSAFNWSRFLYIRHKQQLQFSVSLYQMVRQFSFQEKGSRFESDNLLKNQCLEYAGLAQRERISLTRMRLWVQIPHPVPIVSSYVTASYNPLPLAHGEIK